MLTINGNDICLTRGDTAELNITVLSASGTEYELQAGDKITFTVKKNVYTEDVLIEKEGAQIIIEPADTKELAYGEYTYDVQVTLADGTVSTIIPPSAFKLTAEVTWS